MTPPDPNPSRCLLADVVTASKHISDTSSRSRKVAILAEILTRLEASEVPICVGFLSGVPRQGRVGVGYSTIHGLELWPAGEPSLTVHDVDRAISEIEEASGRGGDGSRTSTSELVTRARASS